MPVAVVTGATGYIAGWVIKKLFERGNYEVRGTVRNASDEKSHDLLALFPNLKLFEADLLKEGTFDDAIKGADVVFHTASPFFVAGVTDAQKQLVDPALNGTLNVLRSVDKAGTVKSVVLTSSVAAIAGKRPAGHVYTEDDWNLDSTLDFEPYRFSKRLAEEAAWNFAKGKPWDLVVINPAGVIGPVLTKRADATSIKGIKGLLDGSMFEEGCFPACFGQVDVRDVAEAHVRAYEIPTAKGRYLATSRKGYSQLELANILTKSGKFGKYKIPTKERAPVTFRPELDTSKIEKDLGLKLMAPEQSFVDMADSVLEFGIVPRAV